MTDSPQKFAIGHLAPESWRAIRRPVPDDVLRRETTRYQDPHGMRWVAAADAALARDELAGLLISYRAAGGAAWALVFRLRVSLAISRPRSVRRSVAMLDELCRVAR